MASLPVDQVRQLQQQGMPNSQIISTLQKDGFTSGEIFDAMNQANTPNAGLPDDLPPPPPPAGGAPPPAPTPASQLFSSPPPSAAPEVPMPSTPPPASPTPSFSPEPMHQDLPRAAPSSNVSTEEYVEAIIDEKWQELEDDIQKVVEWKNRSDQRLNQLTSDVADLKDRFEKLHSALIGKIDTYDKNILEVGAEIKAMEKVFAKVLPAFTENIKHLGDITDRLDSSTKK